MITVRGLSEYRIERPSVVTIGTFDGVHIGHRKILSRLTVYAATHNMQATLLTFFPHPRMVLQKDSGLKLLNTIEEKSDILEEIGLDCLVIHPFTLRFSRLTATRFVREMLVEKLHTKKIIIGYDHRFGRNRTANIQDLEAFGNLFDFSVEEISAQEVNEVSVSSTKIRKALEIGDLKTANEFLGYPYMLSGTVKRGKGLGRTLGFPTANLRIDADYKLIPASGVYAVSCQLDGKKVYGMMNIGSNPTVDGTGQHIEVHFFELDRDLYDLPLRVNLLARLRDERKFDSLEFLKKQLEQDREDALRAIREL
ncbi:bifunctional riboflavin kinase/FAD synthetase [Robiginitalea sp. SC105]|uniref:bifunctional riboflavin kinase/FAD synthetase n=1 Tax=Robiginitalea sp. SC105 TaxID=2762332 RepID=UPI00163A1908|nr:bifunctional riboflavin kinase/FAD synthetase [Robiginitalea sp. SC105]